MAGISVTAGNVVKGANATVTNGYVASATTITAGQSVYLDQTTNTVKLADSDASATAAIASGISLNGGSAGQPVQYITGGPVTMGATLVQGVTYMVSTTAGGIVPSADVTTGSYPCVLGVADSTAVLNVSIAKQSTAAAI